MELIVFDSPVSEADRLDILKYLSAKWNVGGGEISFANQKGDMSALEALAARVRMA